MHATTSLPRSQEALASVRSSNNCLPLMLLFSSCGRSSCYWLACCEFFEFVSPLFLVSSLLVFLRSVPFALSPFPPSLAWVCWSPLSWPGTSSLLFDLWWALVSRIAFVVVRSSCQSGPIPCTCSTVCSELGMLLFCMSFHSPHKSAFWRSFYIGHNRLWISTFVASGSRCPRVFSWRG